MLGPDSVRVCSSQTSPDGYDDDNRHTCDIISNVKTYAWDPQKNELLKHTRGITFEEIVFHIENGGAVEIFEHPNQTQYPDQRVIVVCVEEYAYLVPFVEIGDETFLKTMIPSRKATKRYLEKDSG